MLTNHHLHEGAYQHVAKVAAAQQAYETQLTVHPHAAEFLWFLDEAIVGRRWARRALRARPGVSWRCSAASTPAACRASGSTCALLRVSAVRVNLPGRALCRVRSVPSRRDVPAIVQRATLAMRQMWFDSLPLQHAA